MKTMNKQENLETVEDVMNKMTGEYGSYFNDPADCSWSDFLDLEDLYGSWASHEGDHIIEFDIVPQEWEKDEDGDILNFSEWSYEDIVNIKVTNVRGWESLEESEQEIEDSEIVLAPKENKPYQHAGEVILQHGYEKYAHKGVLVNSVYEKDDVLYKFVGMHHFNTEIYDVTIRPLTEAELKNL